MKAEYFAKKVLVTVLSLTILLMLSGCIKPDTLFSKTENGNLVSASGTEYTHLTNEPNLYYLGDLSFLGSVEGEKKTSQHLGYSYQTGLFSIENDDSHDVLVRYSPNSEWFSLYRKTSLPPFDYSVDNCNRLELVLWKDNTENDIVHSSCGDGISSKDEIEDFLSDVRSQESPRAAGLYELITQPNGMLENCYNYGVIYGFFEDEPYVVLQMNVTSYNDLAYSVNIDGREYVLPEEWLQRLNDN